MLMIFGRHYIKLILQNVWQNAIDYEDDRRLKGLIYLFLMIEKVNVVNLKVKVFFPAENDLVLDLMDLVFNGSQVLSKIHNWHL